MTSHSQNRDKQWCEPSSALTMGTSSQMIDLKKEAPLSTTNQHQRYNSQQSMKSQGQLNKTCMNFHQSLRESPDSDYTPELTVMDQSDLQVTYSNVIPSKLRHGNNQVMPLLPHNLDGVPNTDVALLKRVIQNSSYTMSKSHQKNREFNKLGMAFVMDRELEQPETYQ